jgi:hypothetical protein
MEGADFGASPEGRQEGVRRSALNPGRAGTFA